MSVDSDIGELFDRVRALEANPPGDTGIKFDTYPQVGMWLYAQALGVRPGAWGFEFDAAGPAGIYLHQGSGANYSDITLLNSGVGDGTVHINAQYATIDLGVSFTVRGVIGGILKEVLRVDGDGEIRMQFLPLVDPGTHDGQLWNDAGTIKIST